MNRSLIITLTIAIAVAMFSACSEDNPAEPSAAPTPDGMWEITLESTEGEHDTLIVSNGTFAKQDGKYEFQLPVDCDPVAGRVNCVLLWEEQSRAGNTITFNVVYRYEMNGTAHRDQEVWVDAKFSDAWDTFSTQKFVSVIAGSNGEECVFRGRRTGTFESISK